MVEHPDDNPPPDDQPDVNKFAALADAPVTALGLSSSAADALEQALDVKTVRDLADNKYVRRAQAIVNLTNENMRDHDDLLLSPCYRPSWSWLATIHDRGTAKGGPPPSAVPPCREVSPLTARHSPRAPAEPWGWRSAPGHPTPTPTNTPWQVVPEGGVSH
jgi:hypothetical protein